MRVVQILRCHRGDDARLHNCSSTTGALWFRLQKTAENPQLQFVVGPRFSCRGAEADSHGLAVQHTMGIPRFEAVTVGCVAAAPPSLVVSLVAEHDKVDQATVQFLLQQSLLAHAEDEERARELEDDLVLREQWLLRLVHELHGAGPETQAECSRLELAAIRWCMVKAKILKRKERRKKKKRRKRTRRARFRSCSS